MVDEVVTVVNEALLGFARDLVRDRIILVVIIGGLVPLVLRRLLPRWLRGLVIPLIVAYLSYRFLLWTIEGLT